MKKVYSGRTKLKAHEVRLFLESQSIRAAVMGESTAFTNFSFTPTSEPSVFVDDADFEPAATLVQQFIDRPRTHNAKGTWNCAECGEVIEAQFDACWKCESPRGDVPSDDAAVESTTKSSIAEALSEVELSDHRPDIAHVTTPYNWRLWFEVLIVLVVFQPFYGVPRPLAWLAPSLADNETFPRIAAVHILCYAIIAVFTLAIMYRSGEPLLHFELTRPRWLWDALGAGILLLVCQRIVYVAHDLFVDILNTYFSQPEVYRLLENRGDYPSPRGGIDLAIAAALALSIGFCEELVMRGYLIPRLEQLLRSISASALLGAVLFAAVHWYQSADGVWDAFILGLIFGSVFAYFRRLWPLVLAHSLWDFVAIIQRGSTT